MNKIERTEYKDFYITHIIRPYQDMIINSERAKNYSEKLWLKYPEFRSDREWLLRVMGRLSCIYDTIDPDFFPYGEPKNYILVDLQMAGLKVAWDK